MKMFSVFSTFVLLFFLSFEASGETPQEIAKKVSPSVVLLVMEDENGQPLSMGSGFLVRDGVIATNFHVIEGAARGYAKLAEKKEKFKIGGVLASDEARDLVLLSVESVEAPVLAIGDSSKVEVGDEIYVVGNPRGLERTFSVGIVSSIRKMGDDNLLQITAPISPGSSGGPVVNAKGDVVGIAAATFKGGQNLNFAIPSAYLTSLLTNKKEKVAPLAGLNKKGGKKEKSIFADFGGRNIEGVAVTDFAWDYPGPNGLGIFSISMRNRLKQDVKNIVCLVIFYNKDNQPIDYCLVKYGGVIPAGLAKRAVHNPGIDVGRSIQRMTTPEQGAYVPSTKLEFRVLYFDLGE
jgi:hypothetical protein